MSGNILARETLKMLLDYPERPDGYPEPEDPNDKKKKQVKKDDKKVKKRKKKGVRRRATSRRFSASWSQPKKDLTLS